MWLIILLSLKSLDMNRPSTYSTGPDYSHPYFPPALTLAGTQPQSPPPWTAMAAEIQPSQATPTLPSKRKSKPRNSKKPYKKLKPSAKKSQKPTQKMQKLYRKRAKDYHSSDEEEEPEEAHTEPTAAGGPEDPAASSGSDGEAAVDADAQSDDELGEDGPHQGITKLAEGSRAFKLAFSKIMKKKLPNEPLGPVLSAHKSLVAEKLAEEATEHKAKAETKRLKLLAQEKGHAIPASFLDAKEKHLISVATKGVVKLFNAVSKAQVTQKGLDSAKSKDAKALVKRRKQTFLSELKKSTGEAGNSSSKDNDEPGWAPLRDSYMLTSSKLKNWDKVTDTAVDNHDKVPMGSSSDEE